MIFTARIAILLAVVCAWSAGVGAQETVYRITVVKNVPSKQAADQRLMLESLGYVPAYLTENKDGTASVEYGNFPTKAEAIKMKAQLEREGFSPEGINEAKRGGEAAQGGATFTVLVKKTTKAAEANSVKGELEKQGNINVKVIQVGEEYNVTVGNFPNEAKAQSAMAPIRDRGFPEARAVPVIKGTEVAGGEPGKPTEVGGDQATKKDVREALKGANLATEGLSDEDVEKIAKVIEIKMKSKSGAAESGEKVPSSFAQALVDLERKVSGITKNIEGLTDQVKKIQDEREEQARKTVTIAALFRDSNALAKGKKYEEAIVKIREILNIDANNQPAQSRLGVLENLAAGKDPRGDEAIQNDYANSKLSAQNEEGKGDLNGLQSAKMMWLHIRGLGDKNWEKESDDAIARLDNRIKQMTPAATMVAESNKKLPLVFGSAIGLLTIVVGFLLYRTHKHNKEMMAKIQEATALRPMRGIPTGRRASDWMISAPQNAPPGAGPAGFPPAGDPLAQPGMQAQPSGFAAAGATATAATDDLFAPEPETMTAQPTARVAEAPKHSPASAKPAPAADIFAMPSASEPTPASASAGAGLDDILSGLPGAEASASAGAGAMSGLEDIFSPPPPKPEKKAPEAEPAGISLDDILGLGASSAPSPAPAPAQAPPPSKPKAEKAGALSIFDELEALAGGHGNNNVAPPMPSAERSEIPAMKSDRPVDDLSALDVTVIERPSLDVKPSGGGLDFSGLGLGPEAAETMPGNVAAAAVTTVGSVLTQDFEKDEVGKKPADWKGEFAYSTLTVQNDAPPANSKNYLVYQKKEGVGKVYYSTKFPNTSGVVNVEFDLRCNDKNKFLLGFYIEKDEDFQQSIHTKILRSESQTAPSIHIHGQPAPYLLGTWAHIKYVIDLNAGKIDGYVDNRHVAKGVSLAQVPKYLNTLAIRDNINTTGQLCIDNVQVSKVS